MTPPPAPPPRPRRRTALWGLAATLAVAAAGLWRPALLQLVEYKLYDRNLGAAVSPHQPLEPVVVHIDEASLRTYGHWPWPRARLAELFARLAALEPAAVAVDLLFPEPEATPAPPPLEAAPGGQATRAPAAQPRPVSAGDRALAEVFRTGPFVLGQEFQFGAPAPAAPPCELRPLRAVWVTGDAGAGEPTSPALHSAGDVVCSLPLLTAAADASGFLNAAPDGDGVLRAVPLVIRYRDQLYPSLPLAAVLRARGLEQVTLYADPAGLTAVEFGGARAPVGARGELLLRYRGGRGTFRRVSAAALLEDRVPPELLRGKVVLVGATAFGLDETVATPLDGVLPGVEVLATAADNLLTGEFLSRPRWARGGELLAAVAAGLVATLLLTLGRPAWGVPALAAAGAGVWYGCGWALRARGLVLSPLLPAAGLALAGTAMVFGRYLEAARSAAERATHLAATRNLMMESLASLAEIRDQRTGGRAGLTQRYVRSLCEALAQRPEFRDQLDPARIDTLARLAPLHDIGKASIPDGVLMKSGKLSAAEFSMIKKHTRYGEEVIERARVRAGVERDELLEVARQVVSSHHERWDGSGYPDGTAGAGIPLAGRIVAIVDVYEALTASRPYRSAHPHADAVAIIRAGRGTQFDPDLVDVFLTVADQWAVWAEDG